MSRSNPQELLTNPATKFYSWNSDNECFVYFDKNAGEKDKDGKPKGANISTKLPFNFLVLDQLACVRGFNETDKKGYYSNEVRDLKDIITVKSGKDIKKVGTYEQVKVLTGARYCQSVYIAFKNEAGEFEIQNMQLVGSALNAWINFIKTVKINEIAVSVKSSVEKKKGRNTYKEPVFTAIKVSPEADAKAIELDKQLQAYLTEYLAKNKNSQPEQPTQSADEHVSVNANTNSKNTPEPPSFYGGSDTDDDLPF